MNRRPPNVALVLTTQWRASAMGWTGDPNARTPNLDRLAADSLSLEQAVTPHPFGGFARAAILTGRRCPGNGIRDYYDPLPEGAKTLAHAFGEAGYATAHFGKWQLYERDPAAPVVGEAHAKVVVPPSRRGGFGFWEGFESGFLLNEPWLHGTALAEPTQFEGYQSDVVVGRFGHYLEQRAGERRPFFSVISLDAPHPPYAAPAGGVETVDPSRIRLRRGTTGDSVLRETARRELAGYYAHIEATDAALGRLFESLRRAGEWDNTVLVFTSAHGDMHGVAGHFRKGWPHEESVRVPLIASWPGVLPAARDGALLFSLLDLGPSLLSLAANWDAQGLARFGFQGKNLAPCLLGQASGPRQQEISMPSAPPFAKQCPYAWAAHRTERQTHVFPEGGAPFILDHECEPGFEGAEMA